MMTSSKIPWQTMCVCVCVCVCVCMFVCVCVCVCVTWMRTFRSGDVVSAAVEALLLLVARADSGNTSRAQRPTLLRSVVGKHDVWIT